MKTHLFVTALSALLLISGAETVLANEESFSVHKSDHVFETKTASPRDWYELNSASIEGKTTEFNFVLTNPTPQAKTIVVEARSALAQTNQLLDATYPSQVNPDFSWITDTTRTFDRYTPSLPKTFTVPANSDKAISLPVDVPEFEGELLGAFAFREVEADNAETDSSSQLETSVNIQNEYVIAVHLISDEVDPEPFVFSRSEASSDTTSFGISFQVENPNPSLETLPVNYSIQDSKGNVVLKNEQTLKFKMPPSTATFYKIPWSSDEVKKGKYVLSINGTELPFTIQDEEIVEAKEKMDPERTTFIQSNNWLLWALVFVSILANVLLIIRNKRSKKQS